MSLSRLHSLKGVLFPALKSNSAEICFLSQRASSFLSVPFIEHGYHASASSSTILSDRLRYVHHGRPCCSGKDRTAQDSKAQVPPEKMSLFQKFKAMYRDYWYVLVPVHIVTSTMFYGSFYYMARTGVDVAALAEWAHFGEETVEKIRKTGNSLAGHLTIAYLLYKLATPVRYTVTLGGTTISINYLKKWGWIKPIPKRDELRRMFDDKKIELRRKRDSLRERQELMRKTVLSKLPSKKRIKSTSDLVKRMLMKKRSTRKG